MPRVSVCLDSDLAEWARTEAVARKISTSRFIARLIRQRRESHCAMEHFLANELVKLRKPGGPLPTRINPYDRVRRRRREES